MAMRQRTVQVPSRSGLLGLGVPTTLSDEATAALRRLPQRPLKRMLDELRIWLPGKPVTRANCITFAEPEDSSWEQVVIELAVDTTVDVEKLQRLQLEADAILAAIEDEISGEERASMSDLFAVDLVWESRRDESSGV